MNPRRRWLAAGAAWPAVAWTGALRAQTNAPVVIGWLLPGSRGEARAARAFNEGMAALGWKVGTQYVLEERFAQGRADRLPALAQEIAAKKPAVIVAFTSVAARATIAAAPMTPIVIASGDPVSTGLVTNLARPGGMVTGISNVTFEVNLKLVELLLEAMPKLRRVGFLADSTSTRHAAVVNGVRGAAEHLRVEAAIAEVARPEDIAPAMARLAKDKVQALVLLASVWVGEFHPKIIASALAQRWPVVGTDSGTPRLGGLFSYGPDRIALVRRSATYVDRILKGAKPGDLPIEQPTAFELVLNLKTAMQLGITIPPSMRVRATEVIE
jgi:putative tryptophan/tyrosine transport system substrate-binding protein